MSRDERDEFLRQIKNKENQNKKKERISVPGQKKTRSNNSIMPKKSVWRNSSVLFQKKGSVTVEAALVVPLFLIAALLILSLIDVFRTYEEREYMLFRTVRSAAVYGSVVSSTDSLSLGEEDEIKGQLIYPVTPSVKGLGFQVVVLQNTCICHIFNGYDVNHSKNIDNQEEYVYITESGSVYHISRSCSHLNVSIEEVSKREVSVKRNENGSRYKRCPYCVKNAVQQKVFITSYGNKYHCDIQCPALKRSIQVVKKSECNYPMCKECGKK